MKTEDILKRQKQYDRWNKTTVQEFLGLPDIELDKVEERLSADRQKPWLDIGSLKNSFRNILAKYRGNSDAAYR